MYISNGFEGVYSSPAMQSALRLYLPRQEKTFSQLHLDLGPPQKASPKSACQKKKQ